MRRGGGGGGAGEGSVEGWGAGEGSVGVPRGSRRACWIVIGDVRMIFGGWDIGGVVARRCYVGGLIAVVGWA